jgi:hypothetical protein
MDKSGGPKGCKMEVKSWYLHNNARSRFARRAARYHRVSRMGFWRKHPRIYGAIIPRDVVQSSADFVQHTNSHKFMLRDDVWNAPDVRDVTTELRAVNL